MDGLVGALFLSFFIRQSEQANLKSNALLNGVDWSVSHQFLVQLLGVGVSLLYCSLLTYLLLILIDKIFGLRIEHAKEVEGLDKSVHGEMAYEHLKKFEESRSSL